MRPAIMIIFLISLLHCTNAQGCVTGHESQHAKKKDYSWDFNLDYHEEEYDDSKKAEEVEPNKPQGDELVVTICEYDKNDELYCYDLP